MSRTKERNNMETNKNVFRQAWILSSIFINYLLIGSFIVSRSLYDLVYILIFDIFNIINIFDKENENSIE